MLAIPELTERSSEKLADSFSPKRKEMLDDTATEVNHVFGKYIFVFQNRNLEFNTWE